MAEIFMTGETSDIDAEAPSSLPRLNSLSQADATMEFLKCCGANRWATQLERSRPFANWQELLTTADRIWWNLDRQDWLEAFRSHPQIGERKAAQTVSEQSARWSEGEQSGVREAATGTLSALADANREYLEKFGYIFIVCATGKTTGEMLALCRERLSHEADAELRVAAEEQRRITHLRLRKLLQA